MGKFDNVIEKYNNVGVSMSNIQLAIDGVKDGVYREHILENLTADYRGMDPIVAEAMLEDLFAANGGEFKKENRNGYLYGIVFLMLGAACSFFIIESFIYNEQLIRPALFWAGAIAGIGGAVFYFSKAIRGKFREGDHF
jgi:hypothetical protein